MTKNIIINATKRIDNSQSLLDNITFSDGFTRTSDFTTLKRQLSALQDFFHSTNYLKKLLDKKNLEQKRLKNELDNELTEKLYLLQRVEDHEKLIQKLEKKLLLRKAENENLKDEIQLQYRVKKNTFSTSELKIKIVALKKTRGKLQDLKRYVRILEEDIESLNKKNLSYKSQINKLTISESSLKEENQIWKQSTFEYGNKCQSLESTLSNLQSKFTLINELYQFHDQITTSHRQLTDEQVLEMLDNLSEIEDFSSDKEEYVVMKMKQIMPKILELRGENEQFQIDNLAKDGGLDLETELEIVKNKRLKEDLRHMSADYVKLTEVVKSYENEKKNDEQLFKCAQDENVRLKTDLSELVTNNQCLNRQLYEIHVENQSLRLTIDRYVELLNSSRSSEGDLKIALWNFRSNRDEFRVRCEKSIREISDDRDKATDKYRDLNVEMAKLLKAKESLEIDSNNYRSEITLLKTNLDEALAQKRTYEQNITETNERLSRIEQVNEQLTSERNRLLINERKRIIGFDSIGKLQSELNRWREQAIKAENYKRRIESEITEMYSKLRTKIFHSVSDRKQYGIPTELLINERKPEIIVNRLKDLVVKAIKNNVKLTDKKTSQLKDQITETVRLEYEEQLEKVKVKLMKICLQQVQELNDYWMKKENDCEMRRDAVQSSTTDMQKFKSVSNLASVETNVREPGLSIIETAATKQISDKKQQLPTTGKVFPTVEEKSEMFDKAKITGGNEKRSHNETSENFTGTKRLSVLKERSSLYTPQLQSCYPVKTQFVPVLKEDEIKAVLNDDTLSRNILRELDIVDGNANKRKSNDIIDGQLPVSSTVYRYEVRMVTTRLIFIVCIIIHALLSLLNNK